MAQPKTGVATYWDHEHRATRAKVEVKWDGSTWTDETAYVLDLETATGIYDSVTDLPTMGAGQAGQAVITLSNASERFSPANTSGALYSYLRYGFQRVPVRVSMSVNGSGGTFLPQFTGLIDSAQEWHTGEGESDKGVRLECLDPSAGMQQYKVSTALYQDIPIDDFMGTLLAEAGVTPTDLDASVNVLQYAWADDENVWQECQDLALADGGQFYFDAGGTATFRRMTAWLERSDSTTNQATFTVSDYWSLDLRQNWTDAYTGVTAEYSTRGPSDCIYMYEARDPIEIEAGGTYVFRAQYRYPALEIAAPVSIYDWSAITAAGEDLADDLDIWLESYAQQSIVTMVNANTRHRMYVLNFKIRGIPLVGDESHEVAQDADGSVLTNYWRRAGADTKRWHIRGNPYMQTKAQAARMAGYMRDRLQYPRQLLRFRAPACPYLEIGDRVLVTDTTTGLSAACYVLAIRQTYTAGDVYEGEYTVLPVSNVFGYSSYFIVGTSTYSDSTSARLFY